jgi:hypothetical protein
MRILLDTRDIINLLQRARPAVNEFETYLHDGRHEVVLSMTSVREFAGPLARREDFLRLRPLLQSLERLPHTYVREVTIMADELRAAVAAFNTGAEPQPCSPFVDRWDRTLLPLPGRRPSIADSLVGLRLDEIVYYIYKSAPQMFAPPEHHLPELRKLLDQDRALLRQGRAPAREHFIRSTRRHAASHHVPLPSGREDDFAEWLYRNPDRCPGLRLRHEVFRALTANYTDIPETGDFSDFAQVFAIPYVDAATLDNRIRNYCRIASRKIVKMGGTCNYGDRLYRDLTELMMAKPVRTEP